MVAYKRITDADVHAIRVAHRAGSPATQIADALGVTEGTVRYWVNKDGGREPSKPPVLPDRFRKAIKARRALIAKLAKRTVTIKNRTRKLFPSTGCMRFALKRDHGIDVCKKTVERDLKAMGFKCFKRLAHTHKNPEDLRKRAEFARRWRYQDTSNWVFTDEKTFTCGDYSSGTEWAKKKPDVTGTDASNCCMDTVYVWGAIGLGFRHLVVIRKSLTAGEAARKRNHEPRADRERFTSETYVRRCLSGRVMNHLQATGSRLQADNHRSHTSTHTKEYLASKEVAWTRDWPARIWIWISRAQGRQRNRPLERRLWQRAATRTAVTPGSKSRSGMKGKIVPPNGLKPPSPRQCVDAGMVLIGSFRRPPSENTAHTHAPHTRRNSAVGAHCDRPRPAHTAPPPAAAATSADTRSKQSDTQCVPSHDEP